MLEDEYASASKQFNGSFSNSFWRHKPIRLLFIAAFTMITPCLAREISIWFLITGSTSSGLTNLVSNYTTWMTYTGMKTNPWIYIPDISTGYLLVQVIVSPVMLWELRTWHILYILGTSYTSYTSRNNTDRWRTYVSYPFTYSHQYTLGNPTGTNQ